MIDTPYEREKKARQRRRNMETFAVLYILLLLTVIFVLL